MMLIFKKITDVCPEQWEIYKGSKKVEIIGTVLAVFSLILMAASLGGVIVFAIKLFIFYLYGTV